MRLRGMRCRACSHKHYHPALNSSGSLNPQYQETTSQYFQVVHAHVNLQAPQEQTSPVGCTFRSGLNSTFPPFSLILLQPEDFSQIHDSLKLFVQCSLAVASLHSSYVGQTCLSNFWRAKPHMGSCCSHRAEDGFAFFRTDSLSFSLHRKGRIAALWLPRTGVNCLCSRIDSACRVVVRR